MIIRGNTVATNMLRSDFSEADSSKSSYILNKPDVVKAQNTADAAAKAAKNAQNTADAALPKTGGVVTGPLSVPKPTDNSHAVTKEYCDTVSVELTLSASSWSSSAPYTQSLTVSALTEGRKARAYPRWPEEPNLELKEEASKISAASYEAGSVKFSCWEEKPKIDIPVLLEVYA